MHTEDRNKEELITSPDTLSLPEKMNTTSPATAGIITVQKISRTLMQRRFRIPRNGEIGGDSVRSLIFLLYVPISWRDNIVLLLWGFVIMILISSLSSVTSLQEIGDIEPQDIRE